MKERDRVQFSQGDEARTMLTGHVSRVHPNGRYVTIRTDEKPARTFVREITDTRVEREPRKPERGRGAR